MFKSFEFQNLNVNSWRNHENKPIVFIKFNTFHRFFIDIDDKYYYILTASSNKTVLLQETEKAYCLQHNLSKHNLSVGGGVPHPDLTGTGLWEGTCDQSRGIPKKVHGTSKNIMGWRLEYPSRNDMGPVEVLWDGDPQWWTKWKHNIPSHYVRGR